MRVAYIGSPELFSRGASSIHVMKMCQAMGNLGMDVELIIPYYSGTRKIFDYYGIKNNFKVKKLFPSIAKSGVRHTLHGILSAMYTALNSGKYDIFITRNIVYTFASTTLLKLPTIYDAHHPLINKPAKFLFDSFKNSPYLKRFSTNSRGLGETYAQLCLPREKLVVAPNGVDLERFNDLPDQSSIREKLDLPKSKKIVCYCGNLYEGRGIELLIDVCQGLKDTLFLIVGGLEADNDSYKQIADAKGVHNIVFKGFVPHTDVPLYLKASDVLVLPYTSKMTIKGGTNASDFTSPIKLFEYMAAAKPIVATSLPAIEEILQNRQNSLLVSPDSVKSLSEGINEVLTNAEFAERIAKQAQMDVQNYTWEDRVRAILFDL